MIGDDEAPVHVIGPSKSRLRAMIEQAMANTPGAVKVRPAPAAESAASPQPSAHQIAVAIVAAARELGADPEAIAMGVTTMGGRGNNAIPRARAYAAFAIREVFPGARNVAISRWVSAPDRGYLSTVECHRKLGLIRWWNDETFRRIVQKLREEKC